MHLQTKTGHVMLSRGNSKLKKTYVFNLPAIITCNPTALCAKICYALKAERMYKQTRPARLNNLKQISKDGSWVHSVVNMLRNGKHKFFRIHESGDFISQHYVNQWFAIARAVPSVQFLAFTKRFEWDYSKAPKNMQMVFSVMEDTEMNTVPKNSALAFAGNVKNMSNYVECKQECGEKCRACWNLDKMKKNVHFPKH